MLNAIIQKRKPVEIKNSYKVSISFYAGDNLPYIQKTWFFKNRERFKMLRTLELIERISEIDEWPRSNEEIKEFLCEKSRYEAIGYKTIQAAMDDIMEFNPMDSEYDDYFALQNYEVTYFDSNGKEFKVEISDKD